MSDLLERLRHGVLISDGAMGSLLMGMGADPGQHLDHLNITAPDMVEGLHRQYVQAGADILTTNTFQSSRPRLAEHGLAGQLAAINRAGVALARKARPAFVFASIGPTGMLIEPVGPTTFDEVYEVLREQIEALAAEGPDAILIETQGDLQEARAGLLAGRDCCDIPVVVTMTFGQDGRTSLSGTPPEVAALVLSRLGAAAVGANCGLGPAELFDVVARMPPVSTVPVMCQPNAGIPRLMGGKTVYPGSPDLSAAYAVRMVEAGVTVVGSCCGSTPAFTAAIAAAASHLVPGRVERASGLLLASRSSLVGVGEGRPTALVGERLNPTGRAALADALASGDLGAYREAAIAQVTAGADLLDINVGLPGVDEAVVLPEAVRAVADAVGAGVVLDSTDPTALERGLRRYPGRALVNSVNGSRDSLERVLPIVARYGAAAIIMPLDERGIPKEVAGRLEIARRVLDAAALLGLGPEDFLLDGVVMAAATGHEGVPAALETVERARAELGVGTVLGISNISHGLPGRPTLNAAFTSMAQRAGVDAVMVDVLDPQTRKAVGAGDLLAGRDPNGARYVSIMTGGQPLFSRAGKPDLDPLERLARVVEEGDVEGAVPAAAAALEARVDPLGAIADVLTPAIQRVGAAYGEGTVFLPQVMQAAEAMRRAVTRLKEAVPAGATSDRGTVVLATVAGDIHSIGKEIVGSLLESQGYRVVDLGVDVSAQAVIEAAGKEKADVVGLSALMTTTLPAMADTVAALKGANDVPVVLGGAVLTAAWAASVGAAYAKDAIEAVQVVGELVSRRKD